MFMHSNKAARVRYERCGDKCSRNHACHNFQCVPVIVAASNKIILNIRFILGVCPRQNRFFGFLPCTLACTLAIRNCCKGARPHQALL